MSPLAKRPRRGWPAARRASLVRPGPLPRRGGAEPLPGPPALANRWLH